MAVTKVQGYDNNRKNTSVLPALVKGVATGAGVGYIAKYVLPLTNEEKGTDEYIKVTREIDKQKREYNFRTEKFVSSLKRKENPSYAEKQIIGIFDNMQIGDTVKIGHIRRAINNIAANSPYDLILKE